ncbi:hypothetical protein BACCIP111899_02354 [Bacillus rhizoplanae]|uniref:Uncharacterized protein n=1 Tax=Bacillus rhizoplanae TaxID=2880966 RepID=A0ABN8A0L5_9BACI|nr:hypothetical protein BACCIP111899_02354 [Bacillus rhizoplanae]
MYFLFISLFLKRQKHIFLLYKSNDLRKSPPHLYTLSKYVYMATIAKPRIVVFFYFLGTNFLERIFLLRNYFISKLHYDGFWWWNEWTFSDLDCSICWILFMSNIAEGSLFSVEAPINVPFAPIYLQITPINLVPDKSSSWKQGVNVRIIRHIILIHIISKNAFIQKA